MARATTTIDRRSSAKSSSAGSTAAATAASRRLSLILLASHVRRDQVQDGLHLERRQPRVLAEHERGDAAQRRRREAVAGRADRAAAQPRELDVDAACEELDRRIGVRVEDE